MTLFRSLIRATSLSGFLKHGAGLADGDSVETTNRYVATTHSRSSMFASLFFGVQNPAGGQFTEQGILDAAAAGQADAEGCLRQVLKGVHAFRGAAPQSDDITHAGGAQAPKLDESLAERKLGGMGVYLIRQLTDRSEFRPRAGGGNELQLVKRVGLTK